MKTYVIICLMCLFRINFAHSQNNGDESQSFGAYPGFDVAGEIRALEIQDNGKLLIGGFFYEYQGITEEYLIRLNEDGSKDISFNIGSGFNNVVNALAIQPDGKILAGGFFTTFDGLTATRIIRLNSDGTKDETFDSGTGFNHYLNEIKVQPDGKILIGGFFTSYNGNIANRIIRLNQDGSIDNSFITGTSFSGPALSSDVRAVEILADGKILIGGNFTAYNGSTENYMTRLNNDGTIDDSFNTGIGFNGIVTSIEIQSDDKILVGGAFTSINGNNAYRITRLNEDGSIDLSFDAGVGFDNAVYSIKQLSDERIMVGGIFTSFNNLSENRITCLNPDGSKYAAFSSGTGFNGVVSIGGGLFGSVRAIEQALNGKIIVAGEFSTYNDRIVNNIIGLEFNGVFSDTFISGKGFNGKVNDIKKQPDGRFIVVGDFTAHNNYLNNRIIRFNADGSVDLSFVTGIGFNESVRALEIQGDGKILVGGFFTSYNGTTVNRLARLNSDGTLDTTFNLGGTGSGNAVFDIKVQQDNKILLGGIFTSYNNNTENRIIRLNEDGSKDLTFSTGAGFNNRVETIEIQSDNKILIGGNFTSYNGISQKYITRLNNDGTYDNSFTTTGSGFSNYINDIQYLGNSQILVGGNFVSYNGETGKRLVRLNADGTFDSSFDIGLGFDGEVNEIALLGEGNILIAGDFESFDNQTKNNFICLNSNGSENLSFLIEEAFNDATYAIEALNDNQILIGGDFITYQGNNQSSYLIGLYSSIGILDTPNNQSNQITIFPNPFDQSLNIMGKGFQKLERVELFDINGSLVSTSTTETLNTTGLSSGLYIVRITVEGLTFVHKVIKK